MRKAFPGDCVPKSVCQVPCIIPTAGGTSVAVGCTLWEIYNNTWYSWCILSDQLYFREHWTPFSLPGTDLWNGPVSFRVWGWGDSGGRSDPAGSISVTVFLVWDHFQECGLLWGSDVDLLVSSDAVETRPLVSLSLP